MSWGKGGQEQARGRPATTRSNRFDEVRAVQGRDRFVAECEGIFQILNDFGFGFHVVRAFAVVDRFREAIRANLRIPQLKIPKGRELTEAGDGSGKLGMFIFLLSIEAFGRTIKI